MHNKSTKIDQDLLQKMLASYMDAPNSVDPSWRALFSKKQTQVHQSSTATSQKTNDLYKSSDLYNLLKKYRKHGYKFANLNPIYSQKNDENDPKYDYELDETVFANKNIKDIEEILNNAYCKTFSVSCDHIESEEEKAWIQQRIENDADWRKKISAELRLKILDNLIKAEGLEEFLHIKFKGAKRFSLEGAESCIVGMESIIDSVAQKSADEVIVGMAHRGRLNFATNVFGKQYRALLFEFAGNASVPDGFDASGDVKYHLGAFCQKKSIFGHDIFLSLCPNPSHLEAVNSVAIGKTRAKKDMGKNAVCVLIHGDASFCGQGVVYESMSLEQLDGYKTGGTLHIVINNQVGFTTDPKCARSTKYPSFIGKAFDLPIFYVNADDPEALVHVCKIAVDFRYKFGKDVIIDLVSYRRYGHNEGDEPRFTQPKMYSVIDNHPRITNIYGQSLARDGLITKDGLENLKLDFRKKLDQELEESKSYKPDIKTWVEPVWQDFNIYTQATNTPSTGVKKDLLLGFCAKLCNLPDGFNANSKVLRLLGQRKKAIENGRDIDWGNAESLAFASILHEGNNVRLAGQDCKRGTFSHRHAILVDQKTEEEFCPLNTISQNAKINVVNSHLSEYAALGFEYGYSTANPNNLVIWEAQFGDFANGAQIVIDQFISCAQTKWLCSSGLVMLLPHGYEGQGPEHSSARIERFLQLCAQNNMQVVNCTTPANYFHALKRQVAGKVRKPLVVFTPKSLLRHHLAVSKIEDFTEESLFQEIIADNAFDANIKRIIFCSGKIYYDLLQAKQENKRQDILLVRAEQLYPFAKEKALKHITKHSSAQVAWCQEEPQNMGAWFFVEPILRGIAKKQVLYFGPKAAASPATGYLGVHQKQQRQIVEAALSM